MSNCRCRFTIDIQRGHSDFDRWRTATEVAESEGVSLSTVYRWIRKGKYTTTRIRGRIMVDIGQGESDE